MCKTYCETLVVRGDACDASGRMRMDALFMAMQEGGTRHAERLGASHAAMLERGLFFALMRVHVSVRRMPKAGETLIHTTWPGVSNRFFCPRYHIFALEDGTPVIEAGALWALLDVQARRVVSPLKIDLGFPDNSDIPVPINANPHMPAMGENPASCLRTPVEAEFDINGHVNNTKYVAWLCDMIRDQFGTDVSISDLVVSYEKEIRSKDAFILSLSRNEAEFAFRVLSAEGSRHFSAGGTLLMREDDAL